MGFLAWSLGWFETQSLQLQFTITVCFLCLFPPPYWSKIGHSIAPAPLALLSKKGPSLLLGNLWICNCLILISYEILTSPNNIRILPSRGDENEEIHQLLWCEGDGGSELSTSRTFHSWFPPLCFFYGKILCSVVNFFPNFFLSSCHLVSLCSLLLPSVEFCLLLLSPPWCIIKFSEFKLKGIYINHSGELIWWGWGQWSLY